MATRKGKVKRLLSQYYLEVRIQIFLLFKAFTVLHRNVCAGMKRVRKKLEPRLCSRLCHVNHNTVCRFTYCHIYRWTPALCLVHTKNSFICGFSSCFSANHCLCLLGSLSQNWPWPLYSWLLASGYYDNSRPLSSTLSFMSPVWWISLNCSW